MAMLDLERKFGRKKAQLEVSEYLLRKGIRVSPEAGFFFGEVELSPSAIARALDIDRRVVSSTGEAIAKDPDLMKIFTKLGSTLLLRDVAPELGFGAIEVLPKDPSSRGIILGVVKIITDSGISIRQITTDDPMFSNAEMTVVTEKPIPKELIDRLLKLPEVEKVIVIR